MSLIRAAITLSFVLAAIAPAPAAAGTFHVYGLSLNGAGCPNGWRAHSSAPQKLGQGGLCSRWEIRSTRDGSRMGYGRFAGASMFAGEGARFTGFSIRSRGAARHGMVWKMAMCERPFAGCRHQRPRRGELRDARTALGTASPGGRPVNARHLFAGVQCQESRCANWARGRRAVRVTQAESHAVIEDYTRPAAPPVSGVSSGWNSGQQQLVYSASDQGSGIEYVTLTIDGSLHRTNRHPCARLAAGGYQKPVPCATSTSGEFALNEPGQLADGRHTFLVTARDAGGETASRGQEFWVDNHAPGRVLNQAVAGGDGWRATNDFAVAWQIPDQERGSPIAAAYYKIGTRPQNATDGTRVSGGADIHGLRVPGDGDWPAYVWLEDTAGNADPGKAVEVRLRLDTTAPALAFVAERDAANPAEVRVATADAHSGLADGRIAIRRQGGAGWRALETRREGSELVAAVPDDRLARGTYELQASAWDAVGNSATTRLRADGRVMVLDLPLRGVTRLSAWLARGARGARRARRALRLGYGRTAWLRGVLRLGERRLAHTRVAVDARRPGGRWRALAEAVTGAHGRYAVRLPRGSSRVLRVRFVGSRSLRPAQAVARLQVRGWATLKLRPRRLRRGGTIRFRGRVGHLDAALPAAGKLIQIQYLDGRRWRPAVKLGRTDRRGRFAIRYRFRRISRPTRIHFRILVPSEGGWPYATGWSRVRTAFVRP